MLLCNLHRYFPNYVSRMWMKDASGSPVAALYGPCSVVYDFTLELPMEVTFEDNAVRGRSVLLGPLVSSGQSSVLLSIF